MIEALPGPRGMIGHRHADALVVAMGPPIAVTAVAHEIEIVATLGADHRRVVGHVGIPSIAAGTTEGQTLIDIGTKRFGRRGAGDLGMGDPGAVAQALGPTRVEQVAGAVSGAHYAAAPDGPVSETKDGAGRNRLHEAGEIERHVMGSSCKCR